MNQTATGKRVNGVWCVRVRIRGQWYRASNFDLKRALMMAVAGANPMGRAVSQEVN